MAITVDAVSAALTQNQVAVGTAATGNITINAAATVAVVFIESSLSGGQNDNLISYSTLTLGGQALTHLASAISHSGGGTTGYVDIYYKLAPATGTVTLAITPTGGAGNTQCLNAFAVSYLGACSGVGTAKTVTGTSVASQTITDTLASGDLFVGVCCNGTAAPTVTTGTSDATATGDTSTASHGGNRVAHNSGTGSISIVFGTNSADSSSATGVNLVASTGTGLDVPLLQPPMQFNVHRM